MMRLLVVNPNTSTGATRTIDDAFRALAQPGEAIRTVPAAFGPELIVTPDDDAEAERGVVAAIEAEGMGHDGIILASFGDTGSEFVRGLRPGIPVVGLAGTSLAIARALGGRTAIVSFTERMRPSIEAIVARHGMLEVVERILLLPHDDDFDPGTVQDSHGERLLGLCREAAREGARSVVLAGGPLAGLVEGPDFTVDIPVIDGPRAALSVLRAAI